MATEEDIFRKLKQIPFRDLFQLIREWQIESKQVDPESKNWDEFFDSKLASVGWTLEETRKEYARYSW